MRLVRAIAALGCAVLAAGGAEKCTATAPVVPAHDAAPVEIKEDLGQEAFNRALIGEWVSAWDNPSRDFVRSLTLTAEGKATVTIQDKAGEERVVTGPYAISFVRPPARGSVTLADITIGAPPGEAVVLEQASFGLHGALPGGPYLRVDGDPSAVLKRSAE